MKRKAFTLIELLTVMAITAVMLTLIVLPLFQSFQLTRTAQAFADAQDKGRGLIAQISREVGNAVSVRSAASTIAQLPAIDPVTRVLKNDGTLDDNVLPYTKLDLVPPAQGAPEIDPGTGKPIVDPVTGRPVYRDPISGKLDPSLTRPKGDLNLNVVPGQTLVRYWIGLNRSFNANGSAATYNEPYTGLLVARNGDRDNLFVLRRAEVQPFVYRLRKDNKANSSAWRPNLDYFHSDDDSGTGREFDTRIIDLDDPYFFVANGKYLPEGAANPTGQMPDAQKNTRVANWAKASVVQTDVSRYDMIRPVVAGSPPQIDKSALPTARVVPLIQFRPTRVASEPAAGSAAARPGEAVEGIDRIGPDTYKTDRGLWSNAFVRYYPGIYVPGSTSSMEIAQVDAYGATGIYTGSTAPGGLDAPADAPNNYILFDSKGYEQGLAQATTPYPFTFACLSAGVTDTQPGFPGTEWYKVDAQRQLFAPFRTLTSTGKIVTSFPVDQVGTAGADLGGGLSVNLPYVSIPTGDAAAVSTPAQDAGSPVLSPIKPNTSDHGRNPDYNPNRAFNYLWNTFPELQGSLQRYIDLRMLPNADGTFSPLCPLDPASTSGITGFSVSNGAGKGQSNHVRIVPGSDEVYGPDQTPASGGAPVRYTRVTGSPGPNQYRLVYADLAEPTNGTNAVDYGILGLSTAVTSAGGNFDINAAYNPDNPVSVAIQARFKAGYLQLESDPNVPLPAGKIVVKYRFQFTGPSDSFAVDLDTREVMQILLTVKNYPQSSAPNAQTVTLKATATLRNALR